MSGSPTILWLLSIILLLFIVACVMWALTIHQLHNSLKQEKQKRALVEEKRALDKQYCECENQMQRCENANKRMKRQREMLYESQDALNGNHRAQEIFARLSACELLLTRSKTIQNDQLPD